METNKKMKKPTKKQKYATRTKPLLTNYQKTFFLISVGVKSSVDSNVGRSCYLALCSCGFLSSQGFKTQISHISQMNTIHIIAGGKLPSS